MLIAEAIGYKYHRILTDRIEPTSTAELKSEFDYSFAISYGEFLDFDYTIVSKNALLINLEKELDVLFSEFNSTNRKHIRRSEKIEDLQFHFGVADFERFYKFYSQCEEDRNWYPVPHSELRNSKIIYATYKELPIAGMSAYSHGKFMRLGRIFSLRRSPKLETSSLICGVASKRIVFEFCKYAKQHGFVSLDMGGVDWTSDLKSGISQFKLSFGGDLVPVKIGRYARSGYARLEREMKAVGFDLT